mmetsp:Transcript_60230/g.140778  ORF Transcript_60230/g.140778 Transcript_60230/m.140778 type:complete len:454 (+) Transcript_60230:84-1445(+)
MMAQSGLDFQPAVTTSAEKSEEKSEKRYQAMDLRKGTQEPKVNEQVKDQSPQRKLREEVSAKDVELGDPEPKVSEARDVSTQPEAKARNVDVEYKSQADRRRDSKATARSSSEPVTPGRTEQEAVALGWGGRDRRPSTASSKECQSIAIQTEVAEDATDAPEDTSPKPQAPRRGSTSSLRQPLLGSSARPKARQTRTRSKKEPAPALDPKYAECSCERVLYSAGFRWLVMCIALIIVGGFMLGFYTLKLNSGHRILKNRAVPLPSSQEPQKQPPQPASSGKEHQAATSVTPTSAPVPEQRPASEEKPSHGEQQPATGEKPVASGGGGSSPAVVNPPGAGQAASTSSDPLQSARKELQEDLEDLSKLEKEERETERMKELARGTETSNSIMAQIPGPKQEVHKRQAAIDSVLAQGYESKELKEDEKIRAEKTEVADAEEKVDDIEAARRRGSQG